MNTFSLSLFALLPLAISAVHAQSEGQVLAGQNRAVHRLLQIEALPQTLGTNIHFTEARAGEAEMLRAGGFRRIRMDFGWGATEREKGRYDFSAYDRLLKSMDDNQLRAYWILDYGNKLYARDENSLFADDVKTPPYRAAFAKWAAAAVAHFKNRNVVWEIWNEPNGTGFWSPKPDAKAYSALAVEACRAMRKVAPNECIIGPATSGIDMNFLETCFQAGLLRWWDGVSVHPYRQSDPETAAPEYRALRAMIERYKPKGKAMPIISGEWGYSSAWNNFDVNRQGKYLPRQWLLNQYEEIPISIWYDWHDDGTDAKEPEHHFGTTENEYHENQTPIYTPKPAYIAAQTLSQTLNGFTFNKRLWTGRDADWVLLFTRNAEVRLACWTTDATAHEITLPASDGVFARVDYLGKKLAEVKAKQQKLTLDVSDGVQYLWPQKANALLKQASNWKRVPLENFAVAPLRVAGAANVLLRDAAPSISAFDLKAGNGVYRQVTSVLVVNPLSATPIASLNNGVTVQVSNPTGEAFEGKLRVWMGKRATMQPLKLLPNQAETTAQITWPVGAQTGKLGVEVLDNKNQPVTSLQNVRFVPIDDFARANVAADYAVVPDGDAKIASTQKLEYRNCARTVARPKRASVALGL